MAWIEPITFNGESYYNYDDLNREIGNISYIYDFLTAQGYVITLPYPLITGYTRTNFPSVTTINYVRGNIKALRDGFYTPPGAPAVEVNTARKQIFTYKDANKLELNLKLMYDLMGNLVQSYKRCGTFYSGEEGLL